MQKKSKQTPLYAWHVAQGANMVNFGEYEMPLWYGSGAKNEHLGVLTKAGLFDTSHMALVEIEGKDAFDLLQSCFTRDLTACVGKARTPIVPGRCVYGVFLNEKGQLIDDAIVYLLENNLFLIVVNSEMGNEIAQHLKSHAKGKDIRIKDLTDKVGKIDLQGPLAAVILMKLLKGAEAVFEDMYYFTFKGHFDQESSLADTVRFIDGTPALLSRTGYTGEFGFEIFVKPEDLVNIWEMIFDSGQASGLLPCGLAARDSLRAGAALPLSHVDIGKWPFINNPWMFALPYNARFTGFTKSFIGDEALMHVDKHEFTYAFAGFDLRKVSHDTAVVLDREGKDIGKILTCVTDMGIGRNDGRIFSISSPDKPDDFEPRGLACGFIKVNTELASGQVVELKDGRRKIEVMIVDDIRPDRTARRSIKTMMRMPGQDE